MRCYYSIVILATKGKKHPDGSFGKQYRVACIDDNEPLCIKDTDGAIAGLRPEVSDWFAKSSVYTDVRYAAGFGDALQRQLLEIGVPAPVVHQNFLEFQFPANTRPIRLAAVS